MTFIEKLDILMAAKGITRGGLAKNTGIPYTTIVGFYEKGYENMKLANLKKLAKYFGVTTEYLCNDEVTVPILSCHLSLCRKYLALSDESRQIISSLIERLYDGENNN